MKTIKLSYDLTDLNLNKLEALFSKYEICTGGELVVMSDFFGRDQAKKMRDQMESKKIKTATIRELGYSTYMWRFKSWSNESEFNIEFGANPFAGGLLANTSQGTRGEGYCSYIEIETTNKKFAKEFHKLVLSGNCKEVFEAAI